MKSTGSAFSLLLLTMAAVSSGRNARKYFQQARFQYSLARPDDAMVFLIDSAPPFICEPQEGDERIGGGDRLMARFLLRLRRSSSYYTCSFEENATTDTELKKFMEDFFPERFSGAEWYREFSENIYCTTNSQLPDEYFHMRVQRPHDDRQVKCRSLKDNGRLYLRFPGYPTIVCQIDAEVGPFRFNLPGIDDPLKCAFRVYSEIPLGVTHTDKRLYQSLISELPSRVDGLRTRVVCSRPPASNGSAHFQLVLQGGASYDCRFPGAVPRSLPQAENTPQD